MSRTYTIDKKKYVSVTTVLGDYDTGGLMQWSADCAVEHIRNFLAEGYIESMVDWDKARYAYKEVSKEATDIGTEVHDLVESYITAYLAGEDFDCGGFSKPIDNGYDAFLKWDRGIRPKYIASEMTVHSDTHRYAGTLDCVCKLDGKLYIIDFKTSKAHYPKNAVQLAAYKVAYEEMTGLDVEGVGVLRLDKITGEPDWKDYTNVWERQFQTFLGLNQVWHNYKKRRL